MGCQPTRCRSCERVFKACELSNGLCYECIIKENSILKENKVEISQDIIDDINQNKNENYS